MKFDEIVADIKKEKKSELVGINLKVEKEVKMKFDKLCKNKKITVTAALNAFINKALAEEEHF